MPPILTERMSWRKSRPSDRPRRSSDLTPDEQANAKAAIRVLARRLGGAAKLAEALGAKPATVGNATGTRRTVSAGLALRAARLAGVPLEDMLSGAWPVAGSCPHCGRA